MRAGVGFCFVSICLAQPSWARYSSCPQVTAAVSHIALVACAALQPKCVALWSAGCWWQSSKLPCTPNCSLGNRHSVGERAGWIAPTVGWLKAVLCYARDPLHVVFLRQLPTCDRQICTVISIQDSVCVAMLMHVLLYSGSIAYSTSHL